MKLPRTIARILAPATLAFGVVACGPTPVAAPQQEATSSAPASLPDEIYEDTASQTTSAAVIDENVINSNFRSEVISFLKAQGDWDSFECFRFLNQYSDGQAGANSTCLRPGQYGAEVDGGTTTFRINGDMTPVALANTNTLGLNQKAYELFVAAHEFGHHLQFKNGHYEGAGYTHAQQEAGANLFAFAVLKRDYPQEAQRMWDYHVTMSGAHNDLLEQMDSSNYLNSVRGNDIASIYEHSSSSLNELLGKDHAPNRLSPNTGNPIARATSETQQTGPAVAPTSQSQERSDGRIIVSPRNTERVRINL